MSVLLVRRGGRSGRLPGERAVRIRIGRARKRAASRRRMQVAALAAVVILILAGGYYYLSTRKETGGGQPFVPSGPTFTTSDGFRIAYTLYEPQNGTALASRRVVILLHGLNENRAVWAPFATRLAGENRTVLAIDLRGHGESLLQNGVKRLWQSFITEDPRQFPNMTRDVEAAVAFIDKLYNNPPIAGVGASIGANLLAVYGASGYRLDSAVLLSPGYEYRGLNAYDALPKFGRPLAMAASKGDTVSYNALPNLTARAAGPVTAKTYEGDFHGTNLLKIPAAVEDVVVWLKLNG